MLEITSKYLQTQDILVLLGATLVLGTVWSLRRKETQTGKPAPGPPGRWIFGNALEIPTKADWLLFDEWFKQYGSVVSMDIIGQKMVWLNSPEAINQLLEKRAVTSSERYQYTLCGHLIGFDEIAFFLQPGPEHRQTRKYFHQTIGRGGIDRYNTLMGEEVTKFLARLIGCKEGADLVNQIRHIVGATILRITYGVDVKDYTDPYIQDAELALKHFATTTNTPGEFLVDIFPILRHVPAWFPGADFQRKAKIWKKDLMKAVNRPIELVEKDLQQKIVKDSFAHEHLSEPNLTKENAYVIKWAAVSMYLAGSDTTVASVHAFFRHMMLHPEVQEKCREEIYRVVGQSRLPTWNDRNSLPYVDAIMKEVFRWHPVIPSGGPHILSEDEVYDGIFLKKGTVLFGNVWTLMHDEKYFSKPMEFIPERFLPEGQAVGATALLDPLKYTFGFGRRICPGQELAQRETWLVIANVIATFKIMKPVDATGNAIEPVVDVIPGSISHFAPFDCQVVLVNPKNETMLRESVATLS